MESTTTSKVPSKSTKVRPTGVTILAAFEFLGGILMIVGGGLFNSMMNQYGVSDINGQASAFSALLSGGFIVLGLLSLVVGYGFWVGKSWAWWLGLVSAGLSVLSGLVTFPTGIINMAMGAVIAYYLTRPNIKTFFGQVKA